MMISVNSEFHRNVALKKKTLKARPRADCTGAAVTSLLCITSNITLLIFSSRQYNLIHNIVRVAILILAKIQSMWNVNCKSEKFYFVKLQLNRDGPQQGPKVSWKE